MRLFSGKYRLWVPLALAVFGFACDRPAESTPRGPDRQPLKRPNIVWLVAEDLGFYLPAFGDSTIATPNLDALAAESVRYTHVYSPSGVCAPSRAAVATGMYPTEIGAMHMRTGPWYLPNPSQRTLDGAAKSAPKGVGIYEALPPPFVRMHSEYLREAGYFATNNPKEDYQFRPPVTAWDESGPNAHWRHRAPDQSFFSVFNFEETHESRLFRNDRPLLVPGDLQVDVPPYLPETEVVRNDLRRLYSNILEMDAHVGQVLDELREDGLLESTIVLWFADNGGPMPREKRTLYDAGIRVPMMIRFPDGRRAGEVDDRLVSFIDFLPTMLSLAGIEPPDNISGRPFLGRYADSEPRRYIHAAVDRLDSETDRIRVVGDGRFKYFRNFFPERGYYQALAYRERIPTMGEMLRLRDEGRLDDDAAKWFRDSKPEEELFDTIADPNELTNLAGDPQYAEKLADLRTEYDRWSTEHVDLGMMDEADYVRMIWPEDAQPVTEPPIISIRGGMATITCKTEGASIGYQVLAADESPGGSWKVYNVPFPVQPGARIVAEAHRLGYSPSRRNTQG